LLLVAMTMRDGLSLKLVWDFDKVVVDSLGAVVIRRQKITAHHVHVQASSFKLQVRSPSTAHAGVGHAVFIFTKVVSFSTAWVGEHAVCFYY
jgi:hypothetical protein